MIYYSKRKISIHIVVAAKSNAINCLQNKICICTYSFIVIVWQKSCNSSQIQFFSTHKFFIIIISNDVNVDSKNRRKKCPTTHACLSNGFIKSGVTHTIYRRTPPDKMRSQENKGKPKITNMNMPWTERNVAVSLFLCLLYWCCFVFFGQFMSV